MTNYLVYKTVFSITRISKLFPGMQLNYWRDNILHPESQHNKTEIICSCNSLNTKAQPHSSAVA